TAEPQHLWKVINFYCHGTPLSVPDLPLRPGFGGLQSQASIKTDVTAGSHTPAHPFEASRKALFSVEVKALPIKMDDTLLPAFSRSQSPGPIPSETGSSVQVHADIGSTSLKRPHDGEPTDTEPLAKRDRLIEELDLMASSGSKGATELFLKKHNLDEFNQLHSKLKAPIPKLVEWGCIDVSVTKQAEQQHEIQQHEVEWDLTPLTLTNPEVTTTQQPSLPRGEDKDEIREIRTDIRDIKNQLNVIHDLVRQMYLRNLTARRSS
ncbi:hypothetical protein B0T20DRAFT_353149, partial [Sordaria brevicollis]